MIIVSVLSHSRAMTRSYFVVLFGVLGLVACGDDKGPQVNEPSPGDSNGEHSTDGVHATADTEPDARADTVDVSESSASTNTTPDGGTDVGAAPTSDTEDEDAGAEASVDATDVSPLPSVDPPNVDPPPITTHESLETADGCAGVFNPDQLLELHLELPGADWNTVLADGTYSTFVSAQFRCNDEAPITVGVRRKRSGGQNKVGLKIDINEFVPKQTWYGLRKLSLENGVSEGSTSDGAEVRAYLSEYLAWRIMVLSGAVAGRASLISLRVNGELVGVYVNLEQVDKRFLKDRLGEDQGWLYKKSGGVGDGLKTHEADGLDNPYDDYFCFWGSGNTCSVPPAETLANELPTKLDIPQFLRFGAVNALVANSDGPLFKDNNYYHYDSAAGRVYIPWDLDTTMKSSFSVFSGGSGGTGKNGTTFADVLFTNWRSDYEAILLDLVHNKTPLSTILDEIERAKQVSSTAFDADVYVQGTAAEAAAALTEYWTGRFADVEAELGL